MFDRPDLLTAAGDALETAVWLWGPRVLTAPKTAPVQLKSEAFPHGGFYVMRAEDTVMLVDAGEIGMRGIGGHGHNDVLSFDLWAAGAPLLVDSGTYTYTADPLARQALRSTAAHNALRVDGQETSRLGGDRWLWLIENDAHPRDVTWLSDAEHDVFSASHDGYRRLAEPAIHTRHIVFKKSRRHWRIDDSLTGTGAHLVELFFHPGLPFELENDAVLVRAPRADLWLFPPANTTFHQENGWISRGYGLREPAPVLVYAVRASVPLALRTDLILVPHGTPAAAARSQIERD